VASDALRRLQEELRRVHSPDELPPDLLTALHALAAAFGTSLEAMRDRIVSEDEPPVSFMRPVPTGHDFTSQARLAALVAEGRAVLPKMAKRQRTRDDLIPVKGSISELVIEDRHR
jgi:hypothetical protein